MHQHFAASTQMQARLPTVVEEQLGYTNVMDSLFVLL